MDKFTKPLLTASQQIQHLASKGVSFNIMDQIAAEKYLMENNNYFKLRAFRKNYDKYTTGENAGKYINLDFAMLCDLATIDMHLRYTLLQIALNTEHFLKVKILRKMEQYGEDGYDVVTDYFQHLQNADAANNTKFFDKLISELDRNKGNPYCGGLILACANGYSVWAFIEVVSLGTLLQFYRFCANRFNDKDMMNDFYLMHSVRELRNASAHNNCIINDLRANNSNFNPDKKMAIMLKRAKTIPHSTIQTRLSNVRILQICTLLYTHRKLASDTANEHVRKLLDQLVERIERHKDYYKNNTILVGNYSFFVKIVDILYPKN